MFSYNPPRGLHCATATARSVCSRDDQGANSRGTNTDTLQTRLCPARLVGRIFSRFEDKGLNLIAMKMIQITPELAKQHYAEHVDKPFYPGLEAFITAAPVVAAIVEGLDVIAWSAACSAPPAACRPRQGRSVATSARAAR